MSITLKKNAREFLRFASPVKRSSSRLAEKQALIRFILRCAGNRIAVIASAHTSDSPLEQLRELNAMAEAGVETVVLISNRLARPYEVTASC